MIQQFLRNDFVFKTVKNQEASSKGTEELKQSRANRRHTLLKHTAQGARSEPVCFCLRLDSNTIN